MMILLQIRDWLADYNSESQEQLDKSRNVTWQVQHASHAPKSTEISL